MKNDLEKKQIKKLLFNFGGYEKVRRVCKLKCCSAVRQWVRRKKIPLKHQITLENYRKNAN